MIDFFHYQLLQEENPLATLSIPTHMEEVCNRRSVGVHSLEHDAFVMTQANFSRQPVDEMEFSSHITLSKYPENIKSPGGSVGNTFPICSWTFPDTVT